MPGCSLAVVASACLVTLLAGAAAAQVITVPVPPNASFLRSDPTDFPADATPISLAGLGLTPGSVIRLKSVGDWDNGPGADIHSLADVPGGACARWPRASGRRARTKCAGTASTRAARRSRAAPTSCGSRTRSARARCG